MAKVQKKQQQKQSLAMAKKPVAKKPVAKPAAKKPAPKIIPMARPAMRPTVKKFNLKSYNPFTRFTVKEWGFGLLVLLSLIGIVFIVSTFGMLSCRAARISGVESPERCFAFLKFTMWSGRLLFTGGENGYYISALSIYLAAFAARLGVHFASKK